MSMLGEGPFCITTSVTSCGHDTKTDGSHAFVKVMVISSQTAKEQTTPHAKKMMTLAKFRLL